MTKDWPHAWRELAFTLTAQVLTAVLVGVLLALWWDLRFALGFVFGMLLMASGHLLAARFGLRKSVQPIHVLALVFTSIAWRWLWVLAGLYIALRHWSLPPLAIIFGLIAAVIAAFVSGYYQARFEN